jgi:hypothetical protein
MGETPRSDKRVLTNRIRVTETGVPCLPDENYTRRVSTPIRGEPGRHTLIATAGARLADGTDHLEARIPRTDNQAMARMNARYLITAFRAAPWKASFA